MEKEERLQSLHNFELLISFMGFSGLEPLAETLVLVGWAQWAGRPNVSLASLKSLTNLSC